MNLWLALGIVASGTLASVLLHEVAAIAIEMHGTDFLPLERGIVSSPRR